MALEENFYFTDIFLKNFLNPRVKSMLFCFSLFLRIKTHTPISVLLVAYGVALF